MAKILKNAIIPEKNKVDNVIDSDSFSYYQKWNSDLDVWLNIHFFSLLNFSKKYWYWNTASTFQNQKVW